MVKKEVFEWIRTSRISAFLLLGACSVAPSGATNRCEAAVVKESGGIEILCPPDSLTFRLKSGSGVKCESCLMASARFNARKEAEILIEIYLS